ncbi:MAG: AraC family transcriptional regulator, partial [Opitutaceae bacterium]
IDPKELESAYFQSRVIGRNQYEAVLHLLTIFAKHIGALSNQLMMQQDSSESPAIRRARAYISEHQNEEITLKEIARIVNMSPFYFCKMFKQSTGLTFTDYLARMRVEKVKDILNNPHKRISEAAFETGFQSLSQFNRVFRKITGEAPTTYRMKLYPA